MIRLNDVTTKVRQIAVRNIGRDEPTLLIANDLTTPAKDLFTRYAERMSFENELDAYISGFHLDALSSGVPLNVDLDTTLTVVAGNLYRLFARDLTRYQTATPDTIWRHFLDDDGTLHVTDHGVVCALRLRSHHPQLIDAGYADTKTSIPWWNNRTLQFTFPPPISGNLNAITAPGIEVSHSSTAPGGAAGTRHDHLRTRWLCAQRVADVIRHDRGGPRAGRSDHDGRDDGARPDDQACGRAAQTVTRPRRAGRRPCRRRAGAA